MTKEDIYSNDVNTIILTFILHVPLKEENLVSW